MNDAQWYEESLALLELTPRAIVALVAALPDRLLLVNDGAGSWGPRQVLEHLVWGEVDDWVPRVRLILEEGERTAFIPFDREGGAKRYGTWSIDRVAAEFVRLRAESLQTLRGFRLGAAELAKRGLHPQLGPVTLRELIASWVAHDLSHLDQISRTLARQYKEDVGPWREYMRVLQDA
jgi:hypothetical protein